MHFDDKRRTSKGGIFKWRLFPGIDQSRDVQNRSRWRCLDKLVVFVIFCVTMTSLLIGHRDTIEIWQTLKVTVCETVLIIAVLVSTIKIFKKSRPEFFNFNPDPMSALFEQKEQATPIEKAVPETHVESSTQTDGRNFVLETRRMERYHQREMRRLRRQTHKLKRYMQTELKETRDLVMEKGRQLSDEQLKLLPLVSHKASLLEEKASLETEISEESRRQHDLMERLTRVNNKIQE